jgi:hypothetical protein
MLHVKLALGICLRLKAEQGRLKENDRLGPRTTRGDGSGMLLACE